MITPLSLRSFDDRLRGFLLHSVLMLLGGLITLSASSTRATDFGIDGSTTMRFSGSGAQNITLHKNAIPGWLHVDVSISGPSTISVQDSSFDFDPYDSGANYVFTVYYAAHGASQDTAKITFTDSLLESHVLTVIAYDSAYQNITSDYRIYGGSLGKNHYRYLDGVAISDLDSADITVNATLASGPGYSLGTTAILVHPYAYVYGYYGESLPLQYTPTGHESDTAVVYLHCTTPFDQRDTIYVVTSDTTVPDSNHYAQHNITVAGLDFGTVDVGDTSCQTATIRNDDSVDVTIYTLSNNSANFWMSDPPTLPFVLAKHSTKAVTICFSSTSAGQTLGASFYVDYEDGNLATGSAIIQLIARTSGAPACITANPDSIHFEDVIVGGWVTADIKVKNDANIYEHLLALFSRYDSTLADPFTLDPNPFPLTLLPGDSITVHCKFAPTELGSYGDILTFWPDSSQDCSGAWVSLIGGNVLSGTDTSAIQLLPSQTEILPMTGTSSVFTKTFVFVNNAGMSEKIDDVTLTDNTHFHIISPTTFGMTLTNGSSLSVEIECDADTNGFYRDTVEVVTEQAATTQKFILEAVRQVAQAVNSSASLVTNATLFLSPNPAQGAVSIEVRGAARSNIQVLDLLGREVASTNNTSHWTWAGVSNAGVYFVRASGVDLRGRSFTTTSRVVLEH